MLLSGNDDKQRKPDQTDSYSEADNDTLQQQQAILEQIERDNFLLTTLASQPPPEAAARSPVHIYSDSSLEVFQVPSIVVSDEDGDVKDASPPAKRSQMRARGPRRTSR